VNGDALYRSLRERVMGLHREDEVRTLDGGTARRRRVYLDTTATALMPEVVWRGLAEYLESSSANSHTAAHRAGRSTTAAIEEARDEVARLVGAPAGDEVLFTGNGATGAINFLARALFPPELRLPLKRPTESLTRAVREAFPDRADTLDALLERPLVVTTLMEHHSNILPWVEAVGRPNVRFVRTLSDGRLDLAHLRAIFDEEGRRVRLLTVSGASNVTGVVNPIDDLAALAHRAGAKILVDGAQLAPHRRVQMREIDFLALSGHKLYAPGSRGALVGRMEVLGDRRCIGDVGGGMVEYVSVEDFRVKEEITAREEAGTPNIPGTIALGLVAATLNRIGMERVEHEEQELVGYALEKLLALDGVTVYGPRDPAARVGVFALNVAGLHHGLVSAFLDDHHAVAVRNECFCAHPYVKALLEIGPQAERAYLDEMQAGDRRHVPGMVRLSLGIYSTRADVDAAADALAELWRHRTRVEASYREELDGSFLPAAGRPGAAIYSPAGFVAKSDY
jgi:selenocysteine lyase/cysteine desulfurase